MFGLFKKKSKNIPLKHNLNNEPYIAFSSQETMKELSNFSIFFGSLTRKLLQDKGFEINSSLELTTQRIALLHTEVSELVDAEKKGYSGEDKAMELADIIIRLLNIPIMHIGIYNGIKEQQNSQEIAKYYIKYYFARYDISNNDIYKYAKMRIANDMHNTISLLENALFDYRLDNSENKKIRKNLIIKLIFDVILQCKLYIQISPEIEGKLHEFVEVKMEKNFQRPHRYNTSPNF